MNSVSLEEVLAYNNSDIPARFIKIYGVSEEEAQVLFDDVKRWLWLANKVSVDKVNSSVTIDQSIIVIDEMWHNFVLFTKEYVGFCQKFFGRYMHHAPFAESEKKQMEDKFKDMTTSEKKSYLMDQKRWQYEFVYDHLGQDTFIRWYKEYPKRYSAMALADKLHATEKERHDTKLAAIRERIKDQQNANTESETDSTSDKQDQRKSA
ncbi:hypothetical protein TDB9533_00651 [Thalassocella blandensis]|nr:hypothetical protein TDB9533_00651 [Thalassocella blandensis]